ncbi:hypothetical protein CRENPOLYSF2_450002 [Crenothrix polyspora]|uniref:Uncharacterized protein n=1 Tax=Crenothrix polyspora TaxID=360316 RepID=A0A1R4HFK2_9GAMM|nr:hypothetical protein CRENPOLYSF2_450002 [Crenothrix polyspora]
MAVNFPKHPCSVNKPKKLSLAVELTHPSTTIKTAKNFIVLAHKHATG